MALALDGTAQTANSGSSGALALPAFTTTSSNDIACVGIVTNGGPVTSITGGGLTWLFRVKKDTGSANETTELWYAKANSPIAGVAFTVNTTSAAFITATVFAFSGADYTTIFDSNGAIPTTKDLSGPLSFTTSNANDVLIYVARSGGSSNVDGSFTTLYGTNFQTCGYNIVSATQSGSTVTIGGGALAYSVGDAVIEATGTPAAPGMGSMQTPIFVRNWMVGS